MLSGECQDRGEGRQVRAAPAWALPVLHPAPRTDPGRPLPSGAAPPWTEGGQGGEGGCWPRPYCFPAGVRWQSLALSGDLPGCPCFYPLPSAPAACSSLLSPCVLGSPSWEPAALVNPQMQGRRLPQPGQLPHLGPAPSAPDRDGVLLRPQTPYRESSPWLLLLLSPGGFLLSSGAHLLLPFSFVGRGFQPRAPLPLCPSQLRSSPNPRATILCLGHMATFG